MAALRQLLSARAKAAEQNTSQTEVEYIGIEDEDASLTGLKDTSRTELEYHPTISQDWTNKEEINLRKLIALKETKSTDPSIVANGTTQSEVSEDDSEFANTGVDPDRSTAVRSVPKRSYMATPYTPVEDQRLKVLREAGNSWEEIAKARTS